MSSTTLPVCPKTGSTSPSLTVHLCLHTAPGNRECAPIICLGDVAHPDAWRDRRLVLDLANCPGKRLLVLGNHDTEHHALRNAGFDFDTMCRSAPCATDPPLALSHVPLRTVPPTAVNVHGHLHGAEAPTPRHINVSVEHTDYAPVGLKWILEIALRRVE